MNIWRISLKNIKSKPLYTMLSVLMLSLSVTLLLGIQQLKLSFEHQMANNLGDVDMVVGAKGSPLQLVLSAILHIDDPTGNMSYAEAIKLGKNPMVKKAVPISYGDNYKGYRIVGTTPDFLSFYNAEINQGNYVGQTMEVVLGSETARRLKLNIGDKFQSSHGLVNNEVDVHDDEMIVVGILKPTQTVIDRLIVTNLDSIWDTHNHDSEGHHDESHNEENHDSHEHETHDHDSHDHETHDHDGHETGESSEEINEHNHHDDKKEVTAVLVAFRSPSGLLMLPRSINERTNMQAALPKYELNRLYEFTGVGIKTISWIAILILIISGITIFISLYKITKERAFDLALMRSYGASNFQLIKMIAYEGFVIALIACLFALSILKIGTSVILNSSRVGYLQNILIDLPLNQVVQIIGLVFAIIVLSILLAIFPILKMNISNILSNEK